MKVGILTQPLYCNYGGIIQCYALQTVLKRLGYDTVVLQREFNRTYTVRDVIVYYAKHLIKLILGRESSWHFRISQDKRDYIAKNTIQFITRYISPLSKHCYTTEQLKTEVESLNLDAIIVGSDQVWRPDYSPCQPNYFLDFLPKESPVKRVSFAASFGGDNWLFPAALTQQCSALLKQFDAVSVREQSGIELCETHFGVKAQQVLDPTMLLNRDDYTPLVPNNKESRGDLFCYVLNRNAEILSVINYITQLSGLKPFETMPTLEDSAKNLYGNIEKCVYPAVEEWLESFVQAKMVVTDSFHGTVFSIIFNKPFWVVGNIERGMARFESLLSIFHLNNRMVDVDSMSTIDINEPIDWDRVNIIRKGLQEESNQFIIKALS